jgi:hypothetical protein
MVRFPTVVAVAFTAVITTAAYAHAAPASAGLTAEAGQVLTLTSAKQMVATKLASEGKGTLRPGHAEFIGNGDVDVEILSQMGLPLSHVIVHANDGMITDANAGKKGARG